MKLFEHKDFDQAILGAEQHFRARKLRPAIIEKDYYVTEALRLIANTAGDKVIFKGGTSLAKGWNLIQRFSEDIDLFLDPLAFNPPSARRRSTANSRKSAMRSAATRRSHSLGRRARPSGDSAATTASPTPNASAAPVKSPTASSSKPAPPVAASPPQSSSCAPI